MRKTEREKGRRERRTVTKRSDRKHTSRQHLKKWSPAVNSITYTATEEQDSKEWTKLVHTRSPTLVGQLDRLAIKVAVKVA